MGIKRKDEDEPQISSVATMLGRDLAPTLALALAVARTVDRDAD